MLFATIIYVISILIPMANLVLGVAILLLSIALVSAFITLDSYSEHSKEYSKGISAAKKYAKLGVLVLALLVLIPSQKTAYMMAGAYAAEKVIESPEFKLLAGDVIEIVNAKVKQYAVESKEELDKAIKKSTGNK